MTTNQQPWESKAQTSLPRRLLTMDNACVGLRVKCVNQDSAGKLDIGAWYTVTEKFRDGDWVLMRDGKSFQNKLLSWSGPINNREVELPNT